MLDVTWHNLKRQHVLYRGGHIELQLLFVYATDLFEKLITGNESLKLKYSFFNTLTSFFTHVVERNSIYIFTKES